MSSEVTFQKEVSTNSQTMNVLVDRLNLYKISIEKTVVGTDAAYELDINCHETGADVQVALPHEVLYELAKMLDKSLSF